MRPTARLSVMVVVFAALSLLVNLAGRTFVYDGELHKAVRSGHPDAKRQQLDRDSHGWSAPVAQIVPPLWRVVAAPVPPPGEPEVVADVQAPVWNRPPPPAC